MRFVLLFVLVGSLSDFDCAPALAADTPLEVTRDVDSEVDMGNEGSVFLFPLEIESHAIGPGSGNPGVHLEIVDEIVKLSCVEGPKLMYYEGPLAGTTLAKEVAALSSGVVEGAALSSGVVVGAYSISAPDASGGSETIISRWGAKLRFMNCELETLPDPFNKLSGLLAAFREIAQSHAGLNLVREETFTTRRVDNVPEVKATLKEPGESIFPLTIEHVSIKADAPPQPVIEISDAKIRLTLCEQGMITRFEGLLANTGLAGPVARLTQAELTGARKVHNPFVSDQDFTVIRNNPGYLSVQGPNGSILGDEFPACRAILDVLQGVLVHKAGMRPVGSEPWEGNRFVIDKLPEIEAKLEGPPVSLFPLRVERRVVLLRVSPRFDADSQSQSVEITAPSDVLELTDAGIKLTTPELNTIATYEGALADVGAGRILDLVSAADFAGAWYAHNPAHESQTKIIISNKHGYLRLNRPEWQSLPEQFSKMRWIIFALDKALKSRGSLRLVERKLR